MKALLVFALAAAVRADPGFVYSTGLHTPAATVPLAYTHHNVVPYLHHTVPYVATPVVTNVCKNDVGAVVPCAHPGAGSSIYAYNNVGHPVVQSAVGVAAPGLAVQAPAAQAPAEADSAVVSVEKRDAEADADPYYLYGNYYGFAHPGYYGHRYYNWGHRFYGHPFYGYYGHGLGCRNGYGSLVPCA